MSLSVVEWIVGDGFQSAGSLVLGFGRLGLVFSGMVLRLVAGTAIVVVVRGF